MTLSNNHLLAAFAACMLSYIKPCWDEQHLSKTAIIGTSTPSLIELSHDSREVLCTFQLTV